MIVYPIPIPIPIAMIAMLSHSNSVVKMLIRTQLSACFSRSLSSLSPTTSTLEDVASNHRGLARVVLKKGKAEIFMGGNPMVYSGAVDRIKGWPAPKTGDMVLVSDGSENPIGWGLYNSVSMYCVRLMQLEQDATKDPSCILNMENLLQKRFSAAIDLRTSLGLPSADTNVYRLINSEGDRLSGLIVDVFGEVAVIASSAAWVEKYRQQIESLVSQVSGIRHTWWRASVDILKEGLQVEQSHSPVAQKFKVVENGVYYQVSPEGQKTGFYADQRENRRLISSFSKDKKVLDLCCYTGGFSLGALLGGAHHVTGVDSSMAAIELANENIHLNNLDHERISFVKEDVNEFMKQALLRNEEWDLVILDPPKFAPRKKVLHSARGMYRNLNSLAMQVTKRGGLLMTCSCSSAMTQSRLFIPTLQGAASMSGRRIGVLRQGGAGCDHPINPSYPEGEYLTNVLLTLS